MLPSRLFKFTNMGIPPPLRSLIVIHPSLSPSVAVQLRFRLKLAARPLVTYSTASSTSRARRSRSLHTSARITQEANVSASVSSPSSADASAAETKEPRLQLTFTCTVTNCHERSTHGFTKRAYERGIVIVQCPKCKNRHLIADHLGWFKTTEGTDDGTLKTIEDIMRAKGQTVSRGRIGSDGVVEYVE
ncbi:hypothetical protein ACEPAG_4448 [Sanghuangporus baumii]